MSSLDDEISKINDNTSNTTRFWTRQRM